MTDESGFASHLQERSVRGCGRDEAPGLRTGNGGFEPVSSVRRAASPVFLSGPVLTDESSFATQLQERNVATRLRPGRSAGASDELNDSGLSNLVNSKTSPNGAAVGSLLERSGLRRLDVHRVGHPAIQLQGGSDCRTRHANQYEDPGRRTGNGQRSPCWSVPSTLQTSPVVSLSSARENPLGKPVECRRTGP